MIDIASSEWMAQLIEASNQADITAMFEDDTAIISLAMGKKSCVFTLSAGRVHTAPPDAEPSVSIPVTNKQLVGLVDGSLQLSKAYMQGDIKPVGSSRALLHTIELLDHERVQNHLALLLAD